MGENGLRIQYENPHSGYQFSYERPKVWGISDIEYINDRTGHFFFSPGAMRGFRSKVDHHVYDGPGGVYFVTSEQQDRGKRRYTVRKFDPDTGDVSTASDFMGYGNLRSARGAAERLAGEPLAKWF